MRTAKRPRASSRLNDSTSSLGWNRKRIWALALTSIIFLAACASPDAYTEFDTDSVLVRPSAVSAAAEEYTGATLDRSTVAGVIEVYVKYAGWIREVHYTLDDAAESFVATQAPFVMVLDTNELADGDHRLIIAPRMPNGKVREAVTVRFIVANHSGGDTGGDDDGGTGGDDDGGGTGGGDDGGAGGGTGGDDGGSGGDDGGAGGGGEEPAPNQAPTISLSDNAEVVVGEALQLQANVYDDGLPNNTLSITWSKVSGSGSASFSKPHSATTAVTFSAVGEYLVRAVVSDGQLSSQDTIEVTVREQGGGEQPEDPEPPTDPGDPLDGEFDGPIKITKGGVYSGRWASDSPSVPAVRIETSEPVVIENSVITGPGHLISTDYSRTSNLTVRNTYGYAKNPNVRGRAPGRFIHIESFSNLVVENNYFEGTSGIYAHRFMGGGTVKIRYNVARNVNGMHSDGNGSWLKGSSDYSIVQFTQFNNVNGITGAEIAWNQVVNEPGKSRVEDTISLYNSSGTSSSPIKVHDNFIFGAYPAQPATQSFAGGGIMLGDGGGRYQVAEGNQVLSVVNYGIAISGGSDHLIQGNRVVSAGKLQDGTRLQAANVGIYIWDQHSSTFSNNTGTGNLVGYVQIKSDGSYFRNDWWVPDADSWNGNTKMSGTVDLAAEQAEFDRWEAKLGQAGVSIGVRN